ncbi:MAG: hypothetical protein JF631_09145 [Mycobacterium sp.]|nr:hypothetical protein [Mycobacterium sp.]
MVALRGYHAHPLAGHPGERTHRIEVEIQVGRVRGIHGSILPGALIEDFRQLPDGLVVVGDAFCGFNPIYGQGMTIAALEAIILRDCLRQDNSALPRRYFRAAARKVGVAWQTAVSSDLGLPGVTGSRPLAMRLTGNDLSSCQGPKGVSRPKNRSAATEC